MRKLLLGLASLAALATTLALMLGGSAGAMPSPPQLVVSDGASSAHVMLTRSGAQALQQYQDSVGYSAPLAYHGGPIMPTATTYAIFWVPPHLQNGGATSMSATYQNLMRRFLIDYPGHGIDNNNTQYYQTSGRLTTYIRNAGALGGSYVDTALYPASGCSDSATPGNCINNTQMINEIAKVMGIKGWTGGINKMFLLFTSSNEGSCFSSASTSCAYTQYCAYHTYFTLNAQPVIFGNEPYGKTSTCQIAGVPTPNNFADADTALTAASHELTEAITDPELNAWYGSGGLSEEIGDLCAYKYGANTWDAGKANQSWNGHFYELQMEYDNHVGGVPPNGCVQIGP